MTQFTSEGRPIERFASEHSSEGENWPLLLEKLMVGIWRIAEGFSVSVLELQNQSQEKKVEIPVILVGSWLKVLLRA